jgi:hypothetical protein
MKQSKPAKEQTAGKKKRRRKIIWLLIDLAVLFVFTGLLLYKPAQYQPVTIISGRQVSKYLTHQLLPRVHNGAQQGQPFDVTVTQDGIQDIIAHSGWPKETAGASFSKPSVLFVPDSVLLMATVTLQGVELVVTIELKPRIDEQGLLHLYVAKVKVGAMNLTPLAKIVAKRMYQQRIQAIPIDPSDIRSKIVASLLDDRPFEPVLEIKSIMGGSDTKVQIQKLTVKDSELILRLLPLEH